MTRQEREEMFAKDFLVVVINGERMKVYRGEG